MAEFKRIPLDEKGMPVRKEDAQPEPVDSCDCPSLEREDWDEVESDWSDITFLKASTAAVMGVPVGFDSAREELKKRAVELGLSIPEGAMFLNGAGRFRRPIMLEVEGSAEAKELERPGGIGYSRLFEAPWGKLAKLADQTKKEATEKYGRKPDDVWVWYLTCRHCSKARNFETLIVTHYRHLR